jgi:hypothetical protein
MLSQSILNMHPSFLFDSLIDHNLPPHHTFSPYGYHANMIRFWSNNCDTIRDVLNYVAMYKGYIYLNYDWTNDTHNVFESFLVESRTRSVYMALNLVISNIIGQTCIGNI